MKSLRINFKGAGATTIDLVTPVIDFDCTVQNALVNLGTTRGSDGLFFDKGTDLLNAGLRGALVDVNAANHASNFAAVATVNFVRSQEYPDATETLIGILLYPAYFDQNLLKLQARFTSSLGIVSGITSTIS